MLLVRSLSPGAFLLLLHAGAAPSTLSPSGLPVPPALLVTDELDFGAVAVNEIPKIHALALRNPGDSPVEIRTVRTSCTCLRVALQSNVIPPGQDTTLWVELFLPGDGRPITAHILIYPAKTLATLFKITVRATPKMLILWSPRILSRVGCGRGILFRWQHLGTAEAS
jgi:hypothetical protein